MLKLRYGYLGIGIFMGFIIFLHFLRFLPDNKLRITICDVGQGDSTYLRFPDGRDMLIDGGPSSKVLVCLGKVHPFWDKHLDAVVLTHPDYDHFKGLFNVLDRYTVGVFLTAPVDNPTPLYQELKEKIKTKFIKVQTVTDAHSIKLGAVTIDVLWPAQSFLSQTSDVAGISSMQEASLPVILHRNDYGIVFHLRYGIFDAIFPADVDARVQSYFYRSFYVADGIEFLKVPHHGSRTGMTDDFLSWVKPSYAVISVGAKNRYGHPSPQIIDRLHQIGSKVFRTDKNGSIFVETDGKFFRIQTEK